MCDEFVMVYGIVKNIFDSVIKYYVVNDYCFFGYIVNF